MAAESAGLPVEQRERVPHGPQGGGRLRRDGKGVRVEEEWQWRPGNH